MASDSLREDIFRTELTAALQDIAYQTGPGKYNWEPAEGLAQNATPDDGGPPDVYGCLADGEWISGNGPLLAAWDRALAVIKAFDADLISQCAAIKQGLEEALAFMQETAKFSREWVFYRSYSYPRGVAYANAAYELAGNVKAGEIKEVDEIVALADEFMSWS